MNICKNFSRSMTSKMKSSSSSFKPNILIATNEENVFKQLKAYFQELLGKTSYTIYNIPSKDLSDTNNNTAWRSNCVLLITTTTSEKENQENRVYLDYMRQGGRILTLPTPPTNDQLDLNVEEAYRNESSIECSKIDSFIDQYSHKQSHGRHIVLRTAVPTSDKSLNEKISNILVDIFNLKRGDDDSTKIMEKLEKYNIVSKNQLLQSVTVLKSYLEGSMNAKAQLSTDSNAEFDSNAYFQALKAKRFGTALLFSELVETTMLSIKELPQSLDNLVVIAKRQISGQGNNKNEWLSPKGCCMFTLYINVSSNDFSTSRLSLIQFAAALASVKAVRNSPGCEQLPIRMKWPNDVYYDEKVKLGGILVKTSLLGDRISIKLGVGVNVSNEHPTECINKIMRENNLPEWSCEQFIAKFMNHFEESFKQLCKSTNPQVLNEFLAECEDNWIHKNQTVRVNYWNEDVLITGLNEHGYLKVRRQDNSEHCLQPDGNRFDLMENMIVLRD